jgi:hypothetical protein
MLRPPILLLSIITLVSIAQAADMVVIHSNANELYPIGKILDSQTPINLPTDSEITVVFDSGKVQTVNGPFEGKLQKTFINKELKSDFPKLDSKNNELDNNYLITTLAQFLIERETVRALSSVQAEKLWLVDVTTPTRRFYCVAPAAPVILWRPEEQSQTASTLLIKHKSNGQEVRLEWPAHQTTLAWPSRLPLIYGDTYIVEVKTNRYSTLKKLVLYQLPESLPTNSHKVVWMVGRGCLLQANILLTNLR